MGKQAGIYLDRNGFKGAQAIRQTIVDIAGDHGNGGELLLAQQALHIAL
jgi:hypothetical protein